MSKAIIKYNEAWKKYFQPKRLELLYEIPADALDFLENLTIVNSNTWTEEYEVFTGEFEIDHEFRIWEVTIEYNGETYPLRRLEYYNPGFGFDLSDWGIELEHNNCEDISGEYFDSLFELNIVELQTFEGFIAGFSFQVLCHEQEFERAKTIAKSLRESPEIELVYPHHSDVYIEFKNGMKAKLIKE